MSNIRSNLMEHFFKNIFPEIKSTKNGLIPVSKIFFVSKNKSEMYLH